MNPYKNRCNRNDFFFQHEKLINKNVRLFGGGTKKLLRTASLTNSTGSSYPQLQVQQSVQTPTSEEAGGAATWLNKQRVKLNTKLLGHQPSTMKEDKPTYREQFLPPEMSMLAFLLQKVHCYCCISKISSYCIVLAYRW